MTDTTTPLIAGNWKMNGLGAALAEVDALAGLLAAAPETAGRVRVVVCPPATLLSAVGERARQAGIAVGGQDCHPAPDGAHTGDISARMLRDAGAGFVIVGHSERRTDHAETDELVRRKAEAALAQGLVPIVCVGETAAERERGEAEAVVARQLAGSLPDAAQLSETVVAYEPVWAIGTGVTPTNDDVASMHASIRQRLVERFGEAGMDIKILYGGSLKPANAKAILAIEDVDGGLVGGASLLAKDFFAIICSA